MRNSFVFFESLHANIQHKRTRYLIPHACINTKLNKSRGLNKGSKCITALCFVSTTLVTRNEALANDERIKCVKALACIVKRSNGTLGRLVT